MLSLLPTVTPLRLDSLTTRPGASSGLWLVVLVPLACSPGFYTSFMQCIPPPRLLSLLAIQAGVSGVHLYQQICLSGKKPTPGSNPEYSSSFMLRFVTHPFTPSLVTAGVIYVLTEIHPVIAVLCTSLCAWILYGSTQWLFRTFPGNFSLGEGAIVGQTIALTITCSLYNLGIHLMQTPKLSQTLEISVFIQVAVLVLALHIFIIHRVALLRSPRMFLPSLCISGILGAALSSLILRKWVPLWLLDVLSSSSLRLSLLAWWGGLALLSLLITVWARRKSSLATTVLRKVYHVVIVLVFTPGLLLDPAITHLAAAAAMMLLCLLEFIRMEGLEPISSIISTAFATFLDEKDGGVLILSHIYLLAGVACPLWLNPCTIEDIKGTTSLPTSILPLLAGVLSVGIGDTAASIGGTYFGRRKWFGTKKTVEGSICGILTQMVVVGGLTMFDMVDVTWAIWGRLLVSTSLVAIVEALTDQVDNIVLPLLLYTSLMDL
ncbi:dolichol kinase isoform X2 [Palaemon carinicauda]